MMPKVMDTMLERVGDYDPHARLYGGADAGYYARSDGQSDAAYDRRCCAAGHRSDDRLSEERLTSQKHIIQNTPGFYKPGVFLYVCVQTASLHVQILHFGGVALDEFAPGRDLAAHQHAEGLVRKSSI